MSESYVHEVQVGTGGPMGPPASALSARSAAVEHQGFASIWWGDHYMGWLPRSIWTPDISAVAQPGSNPDTFFDPIAAMAVAGSATSSISIGVTTESVRRHPVALAQQFLTLDHITDGRAILGIGAGEGENITPYGLPFERPVGRMEEGMRLIRLLWDNDGPVDFDGEHYQLRDAVLGLSARKGRRLNMWVMGTGPRICRIAGELGDGWLPTMQSPQEYGDRIRRVRAARTSAGRENEPFTFGMFAFAVVAESLEAARRLLRHPFIKGFCLAMPASAYEAVGATHPLGAATHGITEYVPGRVGRDEALAMIESIPDEVVEGHVLHGTPADIRRQLEPYAALGLEHVVIQNVAPLADPVSAGASFALMGELASGLKYEFTEDIVKGWSL